MSEGGPAGRGDPPLSALAQLQRRFTGDGSSEGALPAHGVSEEMCLMILCQCVVFVGAHQHRSNHQSAWFVVAHLRKSGFAC